MRAPVPLWSVWPAVAARLRAARRLALFSDFDGTLAPIVRHPDQARLPAGTRAALRRLREQGMAVGVVSGRSLRDVRRRVRLPGLYYIGSHGLEWRDSHGRHHARVGRRLARRLQALGEQLQANLARLPGIFVERKTVSVAVHYRNASARTAARARRRVRRAAERLPYRVRLLEGRKVIEVLPPGRMDKGRAVLELAARGGRPRLIYLGDDVTDESVFRRLAAGDIGVHVGEKDRSRAHYRLRSPSEVRELLNRLAKVAQ